MDDQIEPTDEAETLRYHLQGTLGFLKDDLEADPFFLAQKLLARRVVLNRVLRLGPENSHDVIGYEQCVVGVARIAEGGRFWQFNEASHSDMSVGCILHAALYEVRLRERSEPDDGRNLGSEIRTTTLEVLRFVNLASHLNPSQIASYLRRDPGYYGPEIHPSYLSPGGLDPRLISLPDLEALWQHVAAGTPLKTPYLLEARGYPCVLWSTGKAKIMRNKPHWTPIDVWSLLASGRCFSYQEFQSRWPGLVSRDEYLASFNSEEAPEDKQHSTGAKSPALRSIALPARRLHIVYWKPVWLRDYLRTLQSKPAVKHPAGKKPSVRAIHLSPLSDGRKTLSIRPPRR